MVRIAAAGDIHASEATRDRIETAFERVESEADVVLLAGDLTTTGLPEQAQVLADAARGLSIPVFGVLGNHDYHCGRADEIRDVVADAGIRMLERDHSECDVGGVTVGVVGTKGFIGGFPGSALPDFGEPLLREVYAETSREVDALAKGLQEIAHCDLRLVLLHYAPTHETVEGEPLGIHTYLGSERLAQPIAEYTPDLVVHGHAHAGAFAGRIGSVPVYNVAVQVTKRDFYVFELAGAHGHTEVEVEA